MTTPKETLWELDPHTKAKHEILRRYLAAWFPILGTYHSRIVYIDGFSGPGRYKNGEPGSPTIALEVAANHRKSTTGEIVFWFIEERDDRLAHLKQELAAIQRAGAFQGDSGVWTLPREVREASLARSKRTRTTLAPTFAFIDPFGFSGIPFSLIERLLEPQALRGVHHLHGGRHQPLPRAPRGQSGPAHRGGLRWGRGRRDREGARRSHRKAARAVPVEAVERGKYVRFFEMRDRQDRTQLLHVLRDEQRAGAPQDEGGDVEGGPRR